MAQIKNSVGKNGMNLPVETNYVQRLLNKKLQGTPYLKTPLIADGDCGTKTQNAIRDYQQFILKFAHPDSLIQPGKTTINKLMAGVSAVELVKMWNEAVKAENTQIATSGGQIAQATNANKPLPANLTPNPGYICTPVGSGLYSFPLPMLPVESYHTGSRQFGAGRDGRKHAGCDLKVPVGTPICAIADGVVHLGPYRFYKGTYALEVNHGDIRVRYGEILATAAVSSHLSILPEIKKGALVKKGQLIAYVGLMTDRNRSHMLHFECYSNPKLDGPLSDKSKTGGAFKRRSDLMDPTNLLDGAKASLPAHPGSLDAQTLQAAIFRSHNP